MWRLATGLDNTDLGYSNLIGIQSQANFCFCNSCLKNAAHLKSGQKDTKIIILILFSRILVDIVEFILQL